MRDCKLILTFFIAVAVIACEQPAGVEPPADTAPSMVGTVVDQTYMVGEAISALTLPEASGGNGTLSYSLSPTVPGLTFVAATRTLSGTPTVTGSYAMTYQAVDGDDNTTTSDAATLQFIIVVQSKWETSTSTDPLDDSEIVIAKIKADEEHRTEAFIFVARCRTGTRDTDAYIVWGGYLVLGEFPNPYRRSVTVRVGTDAARTETWSVSQSGRATFSREPIRLLRELVDESRLILYTDIPGIGPVYASFEIDGARAALKPIADGCDWSF